MKPENKSSDNLNEVAEFWAETQEMNAKARALSEDVKLAIGTTNALIKSYERANQRDESLERDLMKLREELLLLEQKLGGSKPRAEVGEKNEFPTLWNYLYAAIWGTNGSTYGPTPMHKQSLINAQTLYEQHNAKLLEITQNLSAIRLRLEAVGAPPVRE
jgi:hypothetical protein